MKKLKPSVKLWIKALRSGEFKQAKGALTKDAGYCCLGVACVVYNRTHKRKVVIEGDVLDGNKGVVKNWLGLGYVGGDYDVRSLASDNDNGYSFEEIANIIEKQPKGLFNA